MKYLPPCIERHRHFTPLLLSVNGLQGSEATKASKCLVFGSHWICALSHLDHIGSRSQPMPSSGPKSFRLSSHGALGVRLGLCPLS